MADAEFKVAGVGAMAVGSALLAIASAAAAVALVVTARPILGALFFGLLCLASLVSAAFFGSLRRVERATAIEVLGEAVVAQGVGRGGKGLLGAQVLVVTPRRAVSVPAWPAGAADPDLALDLCDVEHLAVDELSVAISGRQPPIIHLRKASPVAVRGLADAIRSGMREPG